MKTHRFDPISFLAGVAVTAVGLLFLLPTSATDAFTGLARVSAWFWPIVLIAVGLAVLLPAVLPSRKEGTPSDKG